jgi:hypothetical protein
VSVNLIFSIIAACISIGGVFIAVGVFKGRINQNSEINKAQNDQIDKCASKTELAAAVSRGDDQLAAESKRSADQLAAAIKRSDEILKIITERAEEDRKNGAGQFREIYGLLSGHAERIRALETQQTSLNESLKEIKVDIREGFKRMEDNLKELVKR